jgi:hypothetical protein
MRNMLEDGVKGTAYDSIRLEDRALETSVQ